MIAPNQGGDQLAVGDEDQELGGRGLFDLEEVADVLDRAAAGGLDALIGRRGRIRGRRPLEVDCPDLGAFAICRVVAAWGTE